LWKRFCMFMFASFISVDFKGSTQNSKGHLKDFPSLFPSWERFYFAQKMPLSPCCQGQKGPLKRKLELNDNKLVGAGCHSQLGAKLGIGSLPFLGIDPFDQLFRHMVQTVGPGGLAGPDVDKGMVVVAQLHIEEPFKMGGHFLDVHGAAV